MKYIKIITTIIFFIGSCYASLWYGFIKGGEYNANGRFLDAEIKRSNLVKLREGKIDDAIASIEMNMGSDILTAHYTDGSFSKYIIGPWMVETDSDRVFAQRIKEYIENYPYQCHPDKETCDAVLEAIHATSKSDL